jgi:activator of HSP90 ATPase
MKNIKRYYTLYAEPGDVYNALTNRQMLEIWTGENAIMEPVSNTEFSLWNGAITGMNIEFEKNKKMVQQWYFDEYNEASMVTLLLHPHKKGTSVELNHTNIPDEAFENISTGWDEDYFDALKELFI